jgi:ATP-binding cassette, subfamily B, bacterial
MNADLILVMEKGRIVQSGNHEGLMQQTGAYRRIFDIQTRIEDEIEREVSSVAQSVSRHVDLGHLPSS